MATAVPIFHTEICRVRKTAMIDTTHAWIVAHPVVMMFVLFSVGILVSLFSAEIKRFMAYWPGRTAQSAALNTNTNRLKLLESIHGNTYNLVLYLAFNATGLVTMALIWSIILLVGSAIFNHGIVARAWVGPTVTGMCVSKIQMIGRDIKDLYNYDQVSAELRKSIESLKKSMEEKKSKRMTKESV